MGNVQKIAVENPKFIQRRIRWDTMDAFRTSFRGIRSKSIRDCLSLDYLIEKHTDLEDFDIADPGPDFTKAVDARDYVDVLFKKAKVNEANKKITLRRANGESFQEISEDHVGGRNAMTQRQRKTMKRIMETIPRLK
jgi:hypothetical protein